jgi:NifU-like protein
MAWEYSDKTMQLFTDAVHGKPGTHLGEVTDPDGLGEHGSIACGDALRFTFRVRRNKTDPLKDEIIEAKYLTFGCTSAIAASEALCCIIEAGHLTPITALKITNQDIVDFLEGLPEQKIHCSVMGAEALQAAVFNWAQRRGVNLNSLGIDVRADEQEEGRIVCQCFTLTEPYIKRKIKELNLHSIAEITGAIKAGGACMSCHHAPGGLQDLLDDVWAGSSEKNPASTMALPLFLGNPSKPPVSEPAQVPESNPSPFRFAKKIEKLLDDYLRPIVQRDGGDLELIDVKEMTVYLELRGSCAGCAGAAQTLKYLIEKTLKEKIDERIRVIQV